MSLERLRVSRCIDGISSLQSIGAWGLASAIRPCGNGVLVRHRYWLPCVLTIFDNPAHSNACGTIVCRPYATGSTFHTCLGSQTASSG